MSIVPFYVIIPILLIGAIIFKRQPNILSWALTVSSFGLVITFMWATSRWEIVSIYLRTLFPILYLIACVVGFKRIKKQKIPQSKKASILGISANVFLIVIMSGLNWFTFTGFYAPEDTIDLTSPLRNGQYVIVHGGASSFINAHFHVKPQNYALDIVGLNNLGMRASSFAGGTELNNYVIYGDSVYCPCAGTVIIVVDKYNDLIPPETDTKHLAGNHILIECEGVEILLAHLKKGSIIVKQGDIVTTKSVLGQVGNTGNTSEPHLHIHVESGVAPGTIFGKGIPFTINDKFLVRGDIIEF